MGKIFKYIFFSIMLLIVLFTCGAVVLTAPLLPIPSWKNLDSSNLKKGSLTITDKNDNKIFIDDDYVNLKDLPDYVKNSFISVEDKRFFRHYGVDAYRILSAVKSNISAKGYKEGGSTITQQLIKNTHLTIDKTILRKIQEIRISRQAEQTYSKNEILEMYLNSLYFGSNIYGLASASLSFFGVPAKNMTIAQSATCAATINSPANFSPLLNPEKSLKRRNLILGLMLKQNFITEIEYKTAINEELKTVKAQKKSVLYGEILREAQKITGLNKNQIYSGNYKIKTCVDSYMQDKLSSLLRDNTPYGCLGTIVVLDNQSGKIIATAANHSLTGLRRQPGSTIKPLLSFAPILENGLAYTCSPIFDAITDFNGYTPNNFMDKYYGWTNLEDSLIYSLNTPAVIALEKNGIQNALNFTRKCGLSHEKDDTHLDIALGGTKSKFTLQQIVNAYGVLANNGFYTPSSYISEIYDSDNHIIYKNHMDTTKVFGEDTTYLISNILNKCARYGTAKKLDGLNVSAKTGTVGFKDGNTDAYCIAYTPQYTVGVWIGANTGKMANSVSGGTYPASIVQKFFLSFSPNNKSFFIPKSVIKLSVDRQELISRNEVLLAGYNVPKKDCIDVLFSLKNIPKRYSYRDDFFFFDDEFWNLDFNNFKIIDNFFN